MVSAWPIISNNCEYAISYRYQLILESFWGLGGSLLSFLGMMAWWWQNFIGSLNCHRQRVDKVSVWAGKTNRQTHREWERGRQREWEREREENEEEGYSEEREMEERSDRERKVARRKERERKGEIAIYLLDWSCVLFEVMELSSLLAHR